ncbi:hypothetical protein [Plantactinospora sp. KLBMP9567]|nr:hypothetical protein [Plantactinospora sp. KLBMP9567]MDW5328692.1 hypothetical protein [Plantactinospora sp. KLBMP9567]
MPRLAEPLVERGPFRQLPGAPAGSRTGLFPAQLGELLRGLDR